MIKKEKKLETRELVLIKQEQMLKKQVDSQNNAPSKF